MPDDSHTTAEAPSVLKTAYVLEFEGGSLQVNGENYGVRSGDGRLAFDENDLKWEPHEDDDGAHRTLSLPRSELIAIRDFLNKYVKGNEIDG